MDARDGYYSRSELEDILVACKEGQKEFTDLQEDKGRSPLSVEERTDSHLWRAVIESRNE